MADESITPEWGPSVFGENRIGCSGVQCYGEPDDVPRDAASSAGGSR